MKSFKQHLDKIKSTFSSEKGTPVYIDHGIHETPKEKTKKKLKEELSSTTTSPNIKPVDSVHTEYRDNPIFQTNKEHYGHSFFQQESKLEKHHNLDILQESERKSLDKYTVYSKPLNENLFKYHQAGMEYNHPDLHNLDNALSSFRIPKPLTVYSGLRFNPGLAAGQNKHHRLFLPAFTSSSIDPQQAHYFSKTLLRGTNQERKSTTKGPQLLDKHMIQLHLPAGHNGIYIGSRSQLKDEREFILPRNMSIQLHRTPTIFAEKRARSIATKAGNDDDSHDIIYHHIWHAHVVND